MDRSTEVRHKLTTLREAMRRHNASCVRLTGIDSFTWITAGADPTVLLAAEQGIAEVVVTPRAAFVLTDTIEARRLSDEELTGDFEPVVFPWALAASQKETFLAERAKEQGASGPVLSDRPVAGEQPLPADIVRMRRVLLPSEIERYRRVGRLAAEAMTETLAAARPHWTECELAGAGARALWERGLHPALTLVAGARRLPVYRHPTPTHEALGDCAMLVFCARGAGLYANLTRFVRFGSANAAYAQAEHGGALHARVREVEAEVLAATRAGATLADVYRACEAAYAAQGDVDAIREHHQGGTTGYRAREVVATPQRAGGSQGVAESEMLAPGMAVAWNPSVRGAKIEDTFVLTENGTLENLTLDPAWPCGEVRGRMRPLPLDRH